MERRHSKWKALAVCCLFPVSGWAEWYAWDGSGNTVGDFIPVATAEDGIGVSPGNGSYRDLIFIGGAGSLQDFVDYNYGVDLWVEVSVYDDGHIEYYISDDDAVTHGPFLTLEAARDDYATSYPGGGALGSWLSSPSSSGGMTNSASGILSDVEPVLSTSMNVWIAIGVLCAMVFAAIAVNQKYLPKRKGILR